MSFEGEDYRVHRARETIDRTIRKLLFKMGEGKPYNFAVSVIGDLIQFYSITFRYFVEHQKDFAHFIAKFSDTIQISKGFNNIHSFVQQFDKSIPLIEFGEE